MRKSKVIFIKNALVLTVTGLIIRFIGMFFRIWLAGAVGAEGIGLYSQIFSFYVLASAFASTGINTAVTRLVSEELARGNSGGALKALFRCIAVSLTVAGASMVAIYLGADHIAKFFIGDVRSASALKILTTSLPFMAVSSCIKGYFIARKKTSPSSVSQILEQGVRIGIIAALLGRGAKLGIEASCRSVIIGDCIAEGCSCAYVWLCFIFDKKRLTKKSEPLGYSVLSQLKHIALPITVGRYLNSMLRTAENVLVPRKLEAFGMSASDALSVFGIIKGMALPLLFFPASFLNAMSTLLIPEMSEAMASGKKYKVKYTAEKSIHITLVSSLPIAVVFFFAAEPISILVYNDLQVGGIVRMLAPIVPLMYLDSVCDGLLKGLDEQFSVFRNAMLDSLGRLGLIMIILPRYSVAGFVGIMYLSNAFTCLMNLFRLKKVSGAEVKWYRWLFLPLVFSLLMGNIVSLILKPIAIHKLVYTCIFSLIMAVSYVVFVVKFKCLTVDDLR